MQLFNTYIISFRERYKNVYVNKKLLGKSEEHFPRDIVGLLSADSHVAVYLRTKVVANLP